MFENINEGLLDFLEKSPTAFHAVSNIRAALQASGYTELSESQKSDSAGRLHAFHDRSCAQRLSVV